MITTLSSRLRPLLPPRFAPLAIGLIAAAMATGAAFAAWSANGPALLAALSVNGLAWCL